MKNDPKNKRAIAAQQKARLKRLELDTDRLVQELLIIGYHPRNKRGCPLLLIDDLAHEPNA